MEKNKKKRNSLISLLVGSLLALAVSGFTTYNVVTSDVATTEQKVEAAGSVVDNVIEIIDIGSDLLSDD